MAFLLYSNDLQDGAKMPAQQVLNGMGLSWRKPIIAIPGLGWRAGRQQSFVITLYDSDASTGSG